VRREVRSIAALFGDRATAFVGEDATETRARSIDRGARYVHFASHAVIDERLPLNSALVLSPPPAASDADNGLLQVWEIFDRVRLDAELVTLSACETALGGEFSGEGMVGLTRAFQYAGARTVVAALWSISDDSTAQLMTRFYTHLRAGQTKDRALRAAQLDMIRSAGRNAPPFHWAAFQAFGDWR
jgi:CHAT domain-containing protein